MGNLNDLTGRRFGLLTVVGRSGSNVWGNALWLCACDCGNESIVIGSDLKKGHTISCGCSKAPKFDYESRLHHIWRGMRNRCNNPNDKDYGLYGGRGIQVCPQWNDFGAFEKWAKANGYCNELTIDRIDVNGHYCPENCRFATRKTQANNMRTNVMITHNGKTCSISQWAEEAGMNPGTLWGRLHRGWDMERALTEPIHKPK